MQTLRPAAERGHVHSDWLDSRHSFSFGEYHDHAHMGFRALRVINEDHIAGGGGFPQHGHRDMEIITFVIAGALKHHDSMGNGTIIHPGEIQVMSAGTGVLHSEFNVSPSDNVHFLQMWVLSDRTGYTPRYQQKAFDVTAHRNRFDVMVAAEADADAIGGLSIRQDARMLLGAADAGERVAHALDPRRHAWVQIVAGTGSVNGVEIGAGDGVAIAEADAIVLSAMTSMQVVAFDLL